MSEELLPVDVAGGLNVMRCFADFVASRPGLPALVSVRVTWSHTDRCWEVQVQLVSGSAVAEVERWGIALDDAVVMSEEHESAYLGPHMHHEVTGTVHGHLVSVWAAERRGNG
ncbi:hypothetical protein [Yinghuangia sp. YIM S10712]|uniref:hypothetical protein n=1 Tax=Yinghuangia sp. YIM S10712 TaxID=3436930 RepID=UPI003F538AB9